MDKTRRGILGGLLASPLMLMLRKQKLAEENKDGIQLREGVIQPKPLTVNQVRDENRYMSYVNTMTVTGCVTSVVYPPGPLVWLSYGPENEDH